MIENRCCQCGGGFLVDETSGFNQFQCPHFGTANSLTKIAQPIAVAEYAPVENRGAGPIIMWALIAVGVLFCVVMIGGFFLFRYFSQDPLVVVEQRTGQPAKFSNRPVDQPRANKALPQNEGTRQGNPVKVPIDDDGMPSPPDNPFAGDDAAIRKPSAGVSSPMSNPRTNPGTRKKVIDLNTILVLEKNTATISTWTRR